MKRAGKQKKVMATVTISGQQVEVKKIANFMSRMDNGTNDNGKYQKLIEESTDKQRWIQENFRIVRGYLDANLSEAFKVIEA